MTSAYDIVIRPIITEQSMEDLDIKKYAFEVAKDANKIEIKKAIEEIFGVNVDQGHHHCTCKGKEKRTGALSQGYTKTWKKAVVKLQRGFQEHRVLRGHGVREDMR